MRYHCTPIRKAKNKNRQIITSRVGEDVEQLGLSYTVVENTKWYSRKQFDSLLKVKYTLAYEPAIPISHGREMRMYVHTKFCTKILY